MPDDKKTETIYARVPASLKYTFEDMAKDRSRASGERVTLTELLIVAMREYIERQQTTKPE